MPRNSSPEREFILDSDTFDLNEYDDDVDYEPPKETRIARMCKRLSNVFKPKRNYVRFDDKI